MASEEGNGEHAAASEAGSDVRTWRLVLIVWATCFLFIFPMGIWKGEGITGTWRDGVLLSAAGSTCWAAVFTVVVLASSRRRNDVRRQDWN